MSQRYADRRSPIADRRWITRCRVGTRPASMSWAPAPGIRPYGGLHWMSTGRQRSRGGDVSVLAETLARVELTGAVWSRIAGWLGGVPLLDPTVAPVVEFLGAVALLVAWPGRDRRWRRRALLVALGSAGTTGIVAAALRLTGTVTDPYPATFAIWVAVAFAAVTGLPIVLRSAGHGWAGHGRRVTGRPGGAADHRRCVPDHQLPVRDLALRQGCVRPCPHRESGGAGGADRTPARHRLATGTGAPTAARRCRRRRPAGTRSHSGTGRASSCCRRHTSGHRARTYRCSSCSSVRPARRSTGCGPDMRRLSPTPTPRPTTVSPRCWW